MSQEKRYALPSTGVIVTGAASGIGLATARELAAAGRSVALWDINHDEVKRNAQAITEEYGVATAGVCLDLRKPEEIEEAAAVTRRQIGEIGGLVHSAGTVAATGLEGVTVENWDAGLNVHLRPLVLITQAILTDLKRNDGSAIVAISSMNATLGNGLIPIYTAAKGGVLSLVRSMADELGRDGIRVNSVSPGMIDTPMLSGGGGASVPESLAEKWRERILLGRLGSADEVARVVRFLMSDEASYITAAEIVVDGGNISSQRF
ncbi:SDR family NAD(P)-dependent oxidoreductase [Paraburkholderia sacchari]|uniref:SDR family NAD(P)-dependent oxidoreductase n=1 Tax=Paraburkholderia sacchari TaxID=159450 RepID=UPI000541C20A|nr:SDR family oxidoreductase [Paraburkholderia sacchari]NLP64900.1 SDR family oxidoreductase [Paraburkholderia sacchari]